MRTIKEGYRVALVGASSLLGKELLNVLEERRFPISRLVSFTGDEQEPDLPIVDLQEHSQATIQDEDLTEAELDFAFLAVPLGGTGPGVPSPVFLRQAGQGRCTVIDLSESLADVPGKMLSVPFLERRGLAAHPPFDTRLFVSPHPASIVTSSLLLRLAARFPLKSAVAQVFCPAAEMGPKGVEELQKQTVSLLSFQKVPRTVFGAQLAFNLLPRLGGSHGGELAHMEKRIVAELRQYLAGRVPVPAVHLVQVPVFYSFAFLLYVETAEPASPNALERALEGERIRVRPRSAGQLAPSQVETVGTGDILVDAITADAAHPTGRWLWATADNLRLAAVNAVEIAERMCEL